jgi:hypothetical protein
MPSPEQLRDPAYAFEVGASFADSVGLGDLNPLESPQAYAEAMHRINPRTAKGLVRYQLEEDTQQYPVETEAMIMETVENLGILQPEYPFPDEADYEAVLVCGGARNAIPDRGRYAVEGYKSGMNTRSILVAGAVYRHLKDDEKAAVAEWAPQAETERDLADYTREILVNENRDLFNGLSRRVLKSMGIYAAEADQRDVITEVILGEEGLGGVPDKLAVVTTALYVPFKTHDSLSVAKRYDVTVYLVGVPSRPEIVASRTPKTYISEIARTLKAAAHHHATNKRLNI